MTRWQWSKLHAELDKNRGTALQDAVVKLLAIIGMFGTAGFLAYSLINPLNIPTKEDELAWRAQKFRACVDVTKDSNLCKANLILSASDQGQLDKARQ